ncbi:MAG: hypothetical protein ABI811_10055 [Acidobacteriota bacterium]
MKRKPQPKKAQTGKKQALSRSASVVKFDQPNEVRSIARERVGPVKASRAILPKLERKKPKHKKPPATEE